LSNGENVVTKDELSQMGDEIVIYHCHVAGLGTSKST